MPRIRTCPLRNGNFRRGKREQGFHFINSVVKMSIRSSELDDERLGECYARRLADDKNPFNPNGDADGEINSNDGSLFPEVNEDGGDVGNSNMNEESEGGFAQGREEVPQQGIDTTAYHGHAAQARTRIRIQGDESMASSKTPRNSAFAPRCANI